MARVHLGLGTNLGNRLGNLRAAVARLSEIVEIDALSSVYESEPVGDRDQPDFWNLVVRGDTALEPGALLDRIRAIERALGRRSTRRNAPRVIDIDLLLYEGRRLSTAALEVPHPRMLGRAFVLRPLAELDPELRHPVTGRSISEHLSSGGPFERTRKLFPGSRLLDPADDGSHA